MRNQPGKIITQILPGRKLLIKIETIFKKEKPIVEHWDPDTNQWVNNHDYEKYDTEEDMESNVEQNQGVKKLGLKHESEKEKSSSTVPEIKQYDLKSVLDEVDTENWDQDSDDDEIEG